VESKEGFQLALGGPYWYKHRKAMIFAAILHERMEERFSQVKIEPVDPHF